MSINVVKGGLIMAVLLSAQPLLAEEQHRAPIGEFKQGEDAISYAVGASVARNFKHDDVNIDSKLFIEGFKEAMAGGKLKLSDQELRAVMTGFQTDVRRKMASNQLERSLKNQEKADKFLAENGKKSDVLTLPSGVQYKIIKAGEGPKPVDSSTVKVNYSGSLIDGKVFDATLPDKPATLKLMQVIQGWQDAMKQMPVGSKWQLFIPPKLAYGQKGVGNEIGPNELLIFEVELLEIQ